MVMEMKLMVDGDGVYDDGDEDGDEIPLSGVESRINLTPEMKIVMVAVLHIAKESVLLGLRVFHLYKEVRERGVRDDAPRAGGTRWLAPGGWARHPRPFGPPKLICLIQKPRLLLMV